MSEPWLGHRDLCSSQWSDVCDCDPDSLIDLSATHDFDEVDES